MADIAGFYRAFGLEPSHAWPARPDHVALELEFMAFVLLKKRLALVGEEGNPEKDEQASICEAAARSFFRDHLAWWLPSFATGLRRKEGHGFYAELGRVLAAFLPVERGRFDVPAPRLPVQVSLEPRPEEEAGCAACVGPS
jgi:TorA maturation chaperone TorD